MSGTPKALSGQRGLLQGHEQGKIIVWILIPLMALFIVALGLHMGGVTRNMELSIVKGMCKNDFLKPKLGKLCPAPKTRKPRAEPAREPSADQVEAEANIQAQILQDLLAAQTATQKILTSENLTGDLAEDAQKAWESLELALRSYREQGLPEEFMKTVANLTQSIKDGQTQLETALQTIEELRTQLSAKDDQFDNLTGSLDALKMLVASLKRGEDGVPVTDRTFKEAAKTLAEADPTYAANLLGRYKDSPMIITLLVLELKENERMDILQAMDDDLSFKVFDLMTTLNAQAMAAPAETAPAAVTPQ